MIRGSHLLASLLCLLAGGCKTASVDPGGDIPPPRLPERPEVPTARTGTDNSIYVGDALEIFVEEDPSFDGIYRVREGGDIIISGLGRIMVSGMSLSAAKTKIETALEAKQLKQATVIVDRVMKGDRPGSAVGAGVGAGPREEERITVFMTGKVNRPGQHQLPLSNGKSIGVYEGILISGGVSRFGDMEKVHLLRSGDDGRKVKIPVNLKEIEEGSQSDPPLGHGDIVVVPEKVFGF